MLVLGLLLLRTGRLLDIRRVHGLAPHFAVPAQDELAEVVGDTRARLVEVDGIPHDLGGQNSNNKINTVNSVRNLPALAVHRQRKRGRGVRHRTEGARAVPRRAGM